MPGGTGWTTRNRRRAGRGCTAGIALLIIAIAGPGAHATQVGDIVRIKGAESSRLVGLGLVVGLAGTGDGGKFRPAMNPLAKVVRTFIDAETVTEQLKDVKNVALVALEAPTPEGGFREGDRLAVHVSAIGSAKSLKGGQLLMMPMTGPLPDSPVFAHASGPVVIEDPQVPTRGVIRNGAVAVADVHPSYIRQGTITLVLNEANATPQTATTIASIINALDPDDRRIARALDQKSIIVTVPAAELDDPMPFIAEVLGAYIDPGYIETGARVRINERTGTIVMSADVRISPVSISHGELTIRVVEPAPEPTDDAPRVREQRFIGIDPERRGGAKLSDLLSAFNQLEVAVQDRIRIIKTIHAMGKLHAELEFE